ncbi:MAG: N-6 DNA methylase [Ignavibacteria bacterium]|nr:N-6 DNA methylase [Ignavibacteria bacterium]
MLDNETKRRIDTARDILVGKVPDPKSQVEQITIALIYKFMDDMDAEAEELGGERKFFSGEYEQYGWKKLMAQGMGGFEVLTLYSEAIQKLNINPNIPQLFRDIFKNAYLPYRDPQTLKSFLKTIDEFNYDHSERLGDAFEYLLSVLGSQGDAGQFRTPRHIIDFMVYLVDPKKNETILDPACGTAGFLISSYKHIVKSNSSNFNSEGQNDFSFGEINSERYRGDKLTPDERTRLALNIKGYDISPDMVRLSLVNLYLHGFADPKISEYDTLTSEEKWNEHSDIILANPPFMSPKGGIKPHKRFSVESSRSEVLFVDYIAEHLTPNGRAAVIVPEGIIFQSGTAYKSLRKMLVENYLYAVISLPAGVFNPYSGVKTSILLMDKTLAKRTDKILFAKVENDGFDLGAQRLANDKSELPTVANAVKDFAQSILNHTEFDADSYINMVLATKEKVGGNGEWGLGGERYKPQLQIISHFPLVRIGETCDIVGGGTPSKQNSEYWGKGTIKWISSKHISDLMRVTGFELITEKALVESSSKIAPKGSVILITRVSVGKYAYANDDYAINQDLTALIPNGLLDGRYLYAISSHISNQIDASAQGIGVRGVNRDFVANFQIPLPPLEIQKEIVAEIEGWQKIIDGARQVVENYKPQIEIDPSWEMVELGEILKKESLTIEPQFHSGTVKYVGLENISKNTGELIGTTSVNFNEVKSTKICFSKYQILYGKLRPNLNKVWLADFDGICSTDIFVLTPLNYESDIRFYNFYLRSDEFNREVLKGLKGSQLPRVTWDYFSKIKIPKPTFEVQKEIANSIDAERLLINSNKKLIPIFEEKIKAKIAKVWGE